MSGGPGAWGREGQLPNTAAAARGKARVLTRAPGHRQKERVDSTEFTIVSWEAKAAGLLIRRELASCGRRTSVP